jgi:hypothetical protein
MQISEMARALGRRGGLSRARRLSQGRLAEIARMGATARGESLRVAEAIRNNFDYVRAIERLHAPRQVRSELTCSRKLPGFYGAETKD